MKGRLGPNTQFLRTSAILKIPFLLEVHYET